MWRHFSIRTKRRHAAAGLDQTKSIDAVMEERRNELLAVQEAIAAAKSMERIGSTLDVLVEGVSEEEGTGWKADMKGWRLRSTAWSISTVTAWTQIAQAGRGAVPMPESSSR